MGDYFELLRKNAENVYGQDRMMRPCHGTIGPKLTHAQTIGSLIPTAQTWDVYSHINKPPQPVTIEQVFITPPSNEAPKEGCVIEQEFIPQVDADGDVVMVDVQNIVPE